MVEVSSVSGNCKMQGIVAFLYEHTLNVCLLQNKWSLFRRIYILVFPLAVGCAKAPNLLYNQ